LAAVLIFAFWSNPLWAQKRVALVIGNGAYEATTPLPNPRNDASDMALVLKQLGFEVIDAIDVDKATLDRKVRDFAAALSNATVGLFFYAGHGLQVSGANYLVPIDARLETASALDFEAVRLDLVQRTMERSTKTNLIFLDACRNNPLARNLARSMGTRSTEIGRGLAAAESGVGTLISYSTQPGNVAVDGTGRNSPYAASLKARLAKSGDDLMTMLIDVRSDVMNATEQKQVPWEHSAMTGRFYFKEPPAGKPDAATSQAPLPQQGPVPLSMSEAARAWTLIEKSENVAVLAAFRKQYGAANPFYDQLAASRIAEIQQRSALLEETPRAKPPPPKEQKPMTQADEAVRGDWPIPAGDHANQRYSALDQINSTNVGQLRQAWSFSTGVLRGHAGNPLVVGKVMYVHTPFPNFVYALDLDDSGTVIWKYEPRQDPSVIPIMCCDTINRGVTYADGKIFLHQADTTLVALDAATGKELWKIVNGNPERGESGTSAPMAANDKVLVGISGGEFGLRGHLTAYDAHTGKRLWRAYSTGPDDEILFDPERTISLGKPVGSDSSLKTWTGDQWKLGGGTPWGALSYDEELKLVYYGTGNPSTWNPTQRAGPDGKRIDNKWAESIIARSLHTGIAAWAYQMTPFDEWNYDGVNEMILADVEFDGRARKALVHFDKNGIGYTLDRATGELLVAEKFDRTANWTTGVDLDATSRGYGRPNVVARYSTFLNGEDVNTKGVCPSSAGAKGPGPAAFSPRTKLFYVPASNMCMDYEPFKVSYIAGQPYVGATLSIFPPNGDVHRGHIIAWDAAKGSIVWSGKESFAVWSGALATAGDIVFYGTLEGYLKAVDARDGKELFKYKMSSGVVGNVMTFQHAGKQYVAVLSGVGGWAGIGLAAGLSNPTDGLGMVGANADLQKHTSLGGQVVVFSLP
jgi:PQQ-dependent dehydrogenase (methanol/ethanol family)